MRAIVSTVIVLVVVSAACASSDDAGTATTGAADTDGGGTPETELEITVGTDVTPDLMRATLGCEGDAADGTGYLADDPSSACVQVAQGRSMQLLLNGIPADAVCTEVYGGPQIARVEGTLDGRPVDLMLDRANGCGIDAWDQLVPLLPEPDQVG